METISVNEAEKGLKLDNVPNNYRDFQKREGIPIHQGLVIDHWLEPETSTWERTGQQGAFINLYGAEGVSDLQLHDIEPEGQTKVLHHLYDQLVFVVEGNGLTVVGDGDDSVQFEWSNNSLFHIPPGTPYKHINMSDNDTCRLISQTPLPQMFNMYRDEDIIMEPPSNWWAEYKESDFYEIESSLRIIDSDSDDKLSGVPPGTVYWHSNFIPDILSFERLDSNRFRGAGGTSVFFPFTHSGLYAHISEFPIGRYKKAHRHHPAANVSILSGEGFSLLWEKKQNKKIRIDWSRGTIFTPPAHWFHQHFNLGESSARYFALHGPQLGTLEDTGTFDATREENQIEYHDEDPVIREFFRRELESKDIGWNMPNECYTNPEFEFS